MEYGLVALWLVWYLLLGAAALPIASALFPRFPDRGASLALPLGVGVLGLVGYWVGRVQFGAVAAAAGVGVLVLASVVAARYGDSVDVDWNGYAEYAAVFAVAFLFLIVLRALDPGALPGGGEKFLDLGLLSSLARTGALPPQDMWFAGEPVQYYYGGHMIAALLAALTGTEPEFAYNLSLAGFFGLLVTAAYGLAGAVADGRGRSRRRAALLGAFLVAFASNLSTPLRVLAWLTPVVGTFAAETVGFATGRFGSETIAYGYDSFSYWDASGGMVGNINEFPFFAFLNGDLHAHMMSMPLLLLAAGLLYAYWETPASHRWRRRGLVFGAVPALAGLVAVVNTWTFPSVVGLTVLTVAAAPASPATLLPDSLARLVPAAWRGDRATADGVETAGGRTESSEPPLSLREELGRVGGGIGAGLLVGLVGALWTAPFFAGMVIGSTGNRSIELFPASRAGLVGLLLVHGAFLAVGALYLLDRSSLPSPGVYLLRGAALVGLLLAIAWFVDAMVLVVVVPALVVTYLAARTRDDVGFEAILFVGAAGLVTVVEFVYVSEAAGPGRLNTVFKTYTQVWLLFGVAGAVMLTDLARFGPTGRDLRSDLRGLARAARREYERLRRGGTATDGGTTQRDHRGPGGRYEGRPSPLVGHLTNSRLLRLENAGTLLLVVLALSLSLYPAIATYSHVSLHASDDVTRSGEYMVGDPTLDATAYVAEDHSDRAFTSWNPSEAKAIAWVNDLEGQPTLASAPGSLYRWTNAEASLTGVPTLAGWPHEVGYRGADVYAGRVDEVDAIFTGSQERQVELLAKHDVQYIYVGPNERSRYRGDLSVADVPGVRVAQEFETVTIYAVDQDALPTDE